MSALEKAFPTIYKLFNRGESGGAAKTPKPPKAPKPQKPKRGRKGKNDPSPPSAESEAPTVPAASARKPRRAKPSRSGGATVTGLDIDPGQVVAAQVKVDGGVKVDRAVGRPLPLEVYRDGEVVDPLALTEILRELFSGSGLSTRVRIGLANQRVIMRMIEVPPISDRKELAAAVRSLAQDHIPMPIDSVVLDHQPLGLVDTPGGQRQRVLIVAARRDIVERLLESVEAAGLRPEGVDLAAFALIRALRRPGSPADESVLYLSLGGLTNLALAEGSTCVFTRVLSVGLETLIDQVAERCGVGYSDARGLIREFGMRQPERPAPPTSMYAATRVPEPQEEDQPYPSEPAYEEHPPDDHEQPAPEQVPEGDLAQPGGYEDIPEPAYDPYAEVLGGPSTPEPEVPPAPEGGYAFEEGYSEQASAPIAPEGGALSHNEQGEVVRAVVADGVRQIAAEVVNSLSFHAGAGSEVSLDRIVVTGPATEIPALVDGLAAELGQPVDSVTVEASNLGASGEVPLTRLAVAAGLAVGEGPQ